MPRDWGVVVENLPDVGRLVHLAMRLDSFAEDQIRGQLTQMRRRFYEQELTIQARRVGCPGRSGLLRNGPLLSELNEMSIRDATSIVNTYNYDLAAAIAAIRSETPSANRHVYASRLQGWEAQRNQWKSAQINQYAEGTARSLAQAHFVEFNRIEGYAVLQPTSAVCPVCQGWIKRGKVPMKVAMNNPPPYHPNCPHSWALRPDKAPDEECRLLWMGE